MDRTTNIILAATIIWLSAVTGFVSSLWCFGSPRILALGNTFGGGVLLAAGLVHLTTDAFENFSEAGEDTWAVQYDFPWASFFVSLGFLMTLFIEETVLHIIDNTDVTQGRLNNRKSTEEPLTSNESAGYERPSGNIQLCDGISAEGRRSVYTRGRAPTLSRRMYEIATHDHGNHDHGDHDHGAGGVIDRGVAVAIVFLLAISCHSFMAGLGVGAMSGNELWSGMAAVVAHKGLATFTLSTCFIKAGCSKCSLIFYIGLFSVVTPLGILCGSVISADNATNGILIGLAGGSFLYIGVLEVISKEMIDQTDKIYKLFVLILGWGLMSALAIWVY